MVNNSLNGSNPPFSATTPLDAGAGIQVTGPNGNQTIPGNGNRVTLAPGTFLSPGSYTVSGTGGADVGSFTASFTIPSPPALTSPASGPNIPVIRANGITLTWSGGGSNSAIEIDGQSATDSTNTNGASFSCYVLASAGTFTVPPSVLLALPAGHNSGLDFDPSIYPVTFSATGLGLGFITSNYDTPIFTTLQ